MEPISFAHTPATLCLLIITIGVSLVAEFVPTAKGHMILAPFLMTRTRQYHQLVTAGLIHAGYGHLLLNMMTLFFFGPTLELTIGSQGYFIVYLVSLLVGNLYPFFKYRSKPEYLALGASGAISGVVLSYCLYYPLHSIYIFGIVPLPAFLYAVLYIGYSSYAMRQQRDNIGHEAHLAGAVGGILATIAVDPDVIRVLISHFA
jgi:membrane associated rhomboid family serine protease